MRRKNRYIHNQPDWPRFQWDQKKLAKPLASVRHQQGRLIGHMGTQDFRFNKGALKRTEDIAKSSESRAKRWMSSRCVTPSRAGSAWMSAAAGRRTATSRRR
jgi:hypothetical protein